LINKKIGRKVDEGALKRRREYTQVNIDNLDVPELIERHKEAEKDWDDFKKEAKENYEKRLLEMYPTEIAGDSDAIRKQRK
jgi:hypothetical protein